MILSKFRKQLESIGDLQFSLENGIIVPEHFHITEVGLTRKSFIDCGGKHRTERFINFQLWFADDVAHKLNPQKFIGILDEASKALNLTDEEIEVEYQGDTIGKYKLAFESGIFILKSKFTNCLAEDQCGIEPTKKKVLLASVADNSCLPGSGCC